MRNDAFGAELLAAQGGASHAGCFARGGLRPQGFVEQGILWRVTLKFNLYYFSMNAQKLFRFEDLAIWQAAIDVGDELYDIADILEAKRLYRFAEQLRGAGMSISNNIAEGAGTASTNEFRQFLNYARRSCYECANILVVIQRRQHIEEAVRLKLFSSLANLSRKIYSFQQTLR